MFAMNYNLVIFHCLLCMIDRCSNKTQADVTVMLLNLKETLSFEQLLVIFRVQPETVMTYITLAPPH